MHQHRPVAFADYHDDFYAWARDQAKRLRKLQRLAPELPVSVDLPHLAEEIEDLGKSELRGATNLLSQIFFHVIKAASIKQGQAVAYWRTETKTFHRDMLAYFEPSMRPRIDLDSIWTVARDIADSGLRESHDKLSADIPDACPFILAELVSSQFDFDAAVARLRPEQTAG